MRRFMWGIRKGRTMIQNMCDQALKVGQRRNSSASTAVNGLTEMDGGIRSLKRGILLLNIKLTFCAVRIALRRFLKNIKRNMLGRE